MIEGSLDLHGARLTEGVGRRPCYFNTTRSRSSSCGGAERADPWPAPKATLAHQHGKPAARYHWLAPDSGLLHYSKKKCQWVYRKVPGTLSSPTVHASQLRPMKNQYRGAEYCRSTHWRQAFRRSLTVAALQPRREKQLVKQPHLPFVQLSNPGILNTAADPNVPSTGNNFFFRL